MKKFFAGTSALLLLIFTLSGCSPIGNKSGSPRSIYGTAAVISLALLVGCALVVRKNRFWFIALFSSVFIVNSGYTMLAVSTGLEMALWANRISYLGSVFLPLSMLMIILQETNTQYKKRLTYVLSAVAVVIFLIAASPGILPIYYKEVSFAVVNGVSTLIKVYGPLHPFYLVYLVGYFAAMVAVIIRANRLQTIDSTAHAIIIAIAVFVNISVWFIEQMVAFDFEILAISYIISEMFLLGVHLVMNENQRLRELVKQAETINSHPPQENDVDNILDKPLESEYFTAEQIEMFVSGVEKLTPAETAIYEALLARATSKEIMATMNIKESTLKYHNRNIYSKLGVANRKQLLEMNKYIRTAQGRMEVSDK